MHLTRVVAVIVCHAILIYDVWKCVGVVSGVCIFCECCSVFVEKWRLCLCDVVFEFWVLVCVALRAVLVRSMESSQLTDELLCCDLEFLRGLVELCLPIIGYVMIDDESISLSMYLRRSASASSSSSSAFFFCRR